ncbi:NmrA family transcriptional regulator [Rhodococcoides trifolii]|uniref:NmrA family transcriptional regulator n=1 Tax=Rhodococcoides trifolii TaxID=908250 RepID=A0A917LI17_9NOCA|nr:NmrA/HSCARG family protein [Rhodococcus trifolii]GGG25634.1 NmrA family transcriptional regulator [Rhodococcus trifolii]
MAAEPTLPGENVITVLGATGQQGNSVVTALLRAGWHVRAVVRDLHTVRAREAAAAGAQTVVGDFTDRVSLRAAFDGAYGVFSVQPSSGQPGSAVTDDDEVAYGVSVADIAHSVGVAHLVYSSAIAAGDTVTGIGHFDTKSRIESHIAEIGIASTIVRPASFMEILMLPGMGLAHGRLSFLMRAEQAMQFIAVADIGSIVAEVFGAPTEFLGRAVDIAGDAMTGTRAAQLLSDAVGRPISYERMSPEVLAGNAVLGRLAEAVDNGRLAGHADLPALRTRFPFLHRFDLWLAGPGAYSIGDALRTGD